MPSKSLTSTRRWRDLRGPFNFLIDAAEAERLFGDLGRLLPAPAPIYMVRERATPVTGFLVRRTPKLDALDAAFEEYFKQLERSQVARRLGRKVERGALDGAWTSYRKLLAGLLDNAISSSFGRGFAEIFWLYHSATFVRTLRGTLRRLRELDAPTARQWGDTLRYSLLLHALERILEVAYERADAQKEQAWKGDLHSAQQLLLRLRDNVLIVTEDHVGRDLAELASYFRGYLKIDAPDLFFRFARLREWHRQAFTRDAQLRAAAHHLLGADGGPDNLLRAQGYLPFLATCSGYDETSLLTTAELKLWNGLLHKLKEFEILNALRRVIVRVEQTETGDFLCDARASRRLGLGDQPVLLSPDSRPLDYSTSWVVSPEVSRAGLIYDITEFSAVVNRTRLSDRLEQQDTVRQIFHLQHEFNRMARELGLRREKYLGDGAFYSGRRADRLLLLAVLMQRTYVRALAAGFPFDRGMRIALNHSTYQLLPFGDAGDEAASYEVFGYGVVELSRLVSGKKALDIEGIMNTLVAQGYREEEVHDFFSPLIRGDYDLPRAGKEKEGFYVQLTPDGALVNEGIVVTEPFLRELDQLARIRRLFAIRHEGSNYVAFELGKTSSGRTAAVIGVRRLGLANLKGLGRLGVFEVIDVRSWNRQRAALLPPCTLQEAANQAYSSTLTGQWPPAAVDGPAGRPGA